MPNQLAGEKSPYLLQHAENPVEWLPWGENAFQKAREENKPIFLSVGYSTCHWCHVMEHESFENEETAALLNQHFVPVKVDREERPDVDRLYMNFVQLATHSGGWPMSVFLTPDLKPFYGGTYFPPVDAYGRPGFSTVLKSLIKAWNGDREGIEKSAQSSFETLRTYMAVEGAGTFGETWRPVFEACFSQILESYDSEWGGFGGPPKFPRPVVHDFLHAWGNFSGDESVFEASAQTLLLMANRGMNDQLGGGFHRYSVDEFWIVSHFEKMLYDQAQLVISLLEAFQISGDTRFSEAAEKTLRYVWRDLTHIDGGFFAAEDADSLEKYGAIHKEEGAFYVWKKTEIDSLLEAQDARVFCDFYGVDKAGNAPKSGDPHGEFRGKNILFEAESAPVIAKMNGLTLREVNESLTKSREILFEARKKRPRPHRDDKVILAWNGLMISAFARAGWVLNNSKWTRIARLAALFLENELSVDGNWKRHFKDGAADVPAFADDLAALGRAYLDLYDATLETKFLAKARVVADELFEKFWDSEVGGFFSSAPDETILLRGKEDYDGAEPSPSGLAVELFARLFHYLGDVQDFEVAQKTCEAFAQRISGVPSAMPLLLRGKMLLEAPHAHAVVVGEKEASEELLRAARETFAPFRSVILLDDASREFFAEKQEFLHAMTAIDGKPTAYICQNFACQRPVQGASEVRELLTSQ